MSENETRTPEWYREYGKSLLSGSDKDERALGIKYILKAYQDGDNEAAYIVGKLVLQGVLRPDSGENPEEHALKLLCRAANNGSPQARSLLNAGCMNRYNKAFGGTPDKTDSPLVDFDGKKIKINRTGILTPIDAVLEYKDGVNQLTLSANIMFYGAEFLDNPEPFKKAVKDGIMEWQGEYSVFGNQALRVKVNLTTESRLFDNVVVMPVTDDLGEAMVKYSNAIGTKKSKESTKAIVKDKRSFAVSGFKWSSKSRKLIYILSEDGKFDDYEEIKHTVKHEFGHALGLGDLYEDETFSLEGVEKGTYTELDGFHLNNKFYNLVMCDHHGPVSNNDIEMVVLAFRDNKAQLYQPGGFKGKISKALGRGN